MKRAKRSPMQMHYYFLSGLLFLSAASFGQNEKPSALTDTTIYDYDEIFSELDALLDSLYTPRSFFMANVSTGNGFFQYNNAGDTALTKSGLVISPSLGYFHKSGFGVGASASLLAGSATNPWQYSLTGSYDYLQSRSFITGLSISRYLIKKDLPFYTSPLKTEAFGYFTYRKHWLRPSLNASYGWGSRRAVEERTEVIEGVKKKKRNNGNGNGNGNNNNSGGGTTTTTISSYEKIVDFNLQLSVRHDFYFLHLFSERDYIRLTPQLAFMAGSQQFGFNSNINATFTPKGKSSNSITTTQNVTLDNQLAFRPLSVNAQFRTEYAIGKFFVQPQLFFDYYFPAKTNAFTTTYLINTGLIF